MRENNTNNNTAERIATKDKLVSSASSVSATFTTATADQWAAVIATFKPQVTGGGGSSGYTTSYVHNDHLGSTNVLTNSSGSATQVNDYYPYGGDRINTGTPTEARTFIGQIKDTQTGNSYLNNRYYNDNSGQFLSEDPVFWEVGQTQDGKQILLDPQAANSYSYANDNPIIKKDPDGRCPVCVAAVIGAAAFTGAQAYSDISNGQFSGFGAYGKQALFGAGTGATVAILAPVSAIAALGATGSISFGSSVVAQVDNPKNTTGQIDYSQAATQAAVSVATAGVAKVGFSAVSGAKPSTEAFINAFKAGDLSKVGGYFTNSHAKLEWATQLLGASASAAVDVSKNNSSQSSGSQKTKKGK